MSVQMVRLVAALGLASGSLAAALPGCGGVSGSAIVVRVGEQAISKATVDHWTRVVGRGGAFEGSRGKPKHGSARERALALLISSNWLIGEAARQGVPIARAAVEESLARRSGVSGGLPSRLRIAGQTKAGLEFETKAEMAFEAIRETLAERADQVTKRETLTFYRENRQKFTTPEVRITDLVENLPSRETAEHVVARVGAGARFTNAAVYHERVTPAAAEGYIAGKKELVKAIFSAGVGVVSPPLPLNGHWTVFVVRKVIPGRPETFPEARAEATFRLRVARQRALKGRIEREYLARWKARTKCVSGYVAPGCPQFARRLGDYEDPFSPAAHPALAELGAPTTPQ